MIALDDDARRPTTTTEDGDGKRSITATLLGSTMPDDALERKHRGSTASLSRVVAVTLCEKSTNPRQVIAPTHCRSASRVVSTLVVSRRLLRRVVSRRIRSFRVQ